MRAVSQTIRPLTLAVLVSTVVFVGSILSPSAATAATYYVATTGSDTNSGTQAAPFQTIQKAADTVNPGDRVLVNDGVYTDKAARDLVTWIQRSGTAGNPITFQSINKYGAKLSGQNYLTRHGFVVSADYIIIQDFEMYGFGGRATAGGGDGISVSSGSNIQITGNHIHDIGRYCTDEPFGLDAVLLGNGTSAITLDRNLVHDIGRLSPGENGCNPSQPFYQNADHGFYLDGNSNVTIKNNIFYTVNHGWALHIYPNPSSNLNILNNTFAFPNPYRGGHIRFAGPLSNATVANNIFYQPTQGSLSYVSSTLTNVQVQKNITYGGTISADSPPAGVTFSGNLDNTDPKLISPSTNDFHLQSGSAAIDKGITVAGITTDFDGNLRPQGVTYDVGAYEHYATIPAPTNLRIVSQ